MPTSPTFGTSNRHVKYSIEVTVNNRNIANNTSNITVNVWFWRTNTGHTTYGTGTCYCGINGTSYSQSVSSNQKITSSKILLFSKTLNISHDDDGSKIMWVSACISLNTPLSSSDQGFNATLPKIPRASSVSGGSGNIGQTTTISISRASNNFTHALYYSVGTISWELIGWAETSFNWTIPTAIYAQIPTSNSVQVRIICETYTNKGSTYIDVTDVYSKVYVVNSNPTFDASQLTYKDTNSTVTAITGNNQLIVQNQSTLQATFTAATAKNSASIVKYEITFNGVAQSKTTAQTINYGTIDISQNLKLTAKAIDSRGNSTTVSKTISIRAYSTPIFTEFSALRINNFENETKLLANVQISSVNKVNSLKSLQYCMKKVSLSSYSAWTNIQNNTQTQISLDNLFAWNIQFQAKDAFSTIVQSLTVPKGMPILFFDTKKISVGVNCFPIKSNSFEVNGQTVFDMVYPVGSIYMSINSANPSVLFGGTWVSLGQTLSSTTFAWKRTA